MSCRQGCARCCHGLFDISIPDSQRVAEGFRTIPREVREQVAERAAMIQSRIEEEEPDLGYPFYLNSLSQDRVDRLVEAIGDVRCPFLDESDSCLIYEYRPIACILEGVPMVDVHDGLFGDWCELNFRDGFSPEMQPDLRLDYYEVQEAEQETTILIPSVISRLCPSLQPVTCNL